MLVNKEEIGSCYNVSYFLLSVAEISLLGKMSVGADRPVNAGSVYCSNLARCLKV